MLHRLPEMPIRGQIFREASELGTRSSVELLGFIAHAPIAPAYQVRGCQQVRVDCL